MSHRKQRPLSQLIYKRIQDTGASPRLLTMHDYKQFGQDVKNYGLATSPDATIIGLESYKGVFVGKEIVGYTWFVGPNEQPSPLFFGDALAEIERFLWDEVDRQQDEEAELPFLLGVGQGAIMALATAAAAPDLLSGVIAVEGFLPVVPGWKPPLAPLDGLPILVLETAESRANNVLSDQRLISTLSAWGGNVTHQYINAGDVPATEMSTWLATQPSRFRRSSNELIKYQPPDGS